MPPDNYKNPTNGYSHETAQRLECFGKLIKLTLGKSSCLNITGFQFSEQINQPGDTALLETLQTGLPKNDFHFRFLVETIVTSSQFLSRRR